MSLVISNIFLVVALLLAQNQMSVTSPAAPDPLVICSLMKEKYPHTKIPECTESNLEVLRKFTTALIALGFDPSDPTAPPNRKLSSIFLKHRPDENTEEVASSDSQPPSFNLLDLNRPFLPSNFSKAPKMSNVPSSEEGANDPEDGVTDLAESGVSRRQVMSEAEIKSLIETERTYLRGPLPKNVIEKVNKTPESNYYYNSMLFDVISEDMYEEYLRKYFP